MTLTPEVQVKVETAEARLRASPFLEHSPHMVSWEEAAQRGGALCQGTG